MTKWPNMARPFPNTRLISRHVDMFVDKTINKQPFFSTKQLPDNVCDVVTQKNTTEIHVIALIES